MSSKPPSFSFYNSLLRDVSRSFYLTLRMLPRKVRWPIGLAYLLARAADTIADTDLVTVERRLAALRQFREKILGNQSDPLDLGDIMQPQIVHSPRVVGQGTSAEWILLGALEDVLTGLTLFPARDRELIRQVLDTIISGQELDLKRFGSPRPGQIRSLDTAEELDDYTYRVAGCVGEFWTNICQTHLFDPRNLQLPSLLADGIRYGKGLQLVNILRDIPADLRNGRCYIPREQLNALDLTPVRLTDPDSEHAFRPLYQQWLQRAEEHLAAGWRYTNCLPRSFLRLRLACAWPILIGQKTLHRLRQEPVLNPDHRVKVTRAEVRGILARTLIALPFARRWQRLFNQAEIPFPKGN